MNPIQAKNAAALLIAAGPRYPWGDGSGAHYATRSHWQDADTAKLEVLVAAATTPDKAADVLGRSPTSIAHRARDAGLFLPPEWSKLAAPKRKRVITPPRIQLAYPFIIRKRDEHADLLAVNRMVAQYLPGREDICQEIMLAMWEGTITLAELEAKRENLRAFVRSFRRNNFEQSGAAVSLDAPIRRNHDGGDLYLQDVISDDEYRERMDRLEAEADGIAEPYRTLAPFGAQPKPSARPVEPKREPMTTWRYDA